MPFWAEPFTTLRLQKIFNLMQDPCERADITSNTFWDWQINHVGSMYGVMDDIFKFAATFKDYPPRSSPPSFNPANIMEETLRTDESQAEAGDRIPDAQRGDGRREHKDKGVEMKRVLTVKLLVIRGPTFALVVTLSSKSTP